MPRSSYGSRRALPWATAQKPRPTPRVVRLGRAANDNECRSGKQTRLLMAGLAIAVAAIALAAIWLPV